jgi:hypothetical protein
MNFQNIAPIEKMLPKSKNKRFLDVKEESK